MERHIPPCGDETLTEARFATPVVCTLSFMEFTGQSRCEKILSYLAINPDVVRYLRGFKVTFKSCQFFTCIDCVLSILDTNDSNGSNSSSGNGPLQFALPNIRPISPVQEVRYVNGSTGPTASYSRMKTEKSSTSVQWIPSGNGVASSGSDHYLEKLLQKLYNRDVLAPDAIEELNKLCSAEKKSNVSLSKEEYSILKLLLRYHWQDNEDEDYESSGDELAPDQISSISPIKINSTHLPIITRFYEQYKSFGMRFISVYFTIFHKISGKEMDNFLSRLQKVRSTL